MRGLGGEKVANNRSKRRLILTRLGSRFRNRTLISLILILGVALSAPATDSCLSFDGLGDFVHLPDQLVWGSKILTVELWFKTNGNGVLFGYQDTEAGNTPAVSNFVPSLFVGTDGRLHAAFWSSTIDGQGGYKGFISNTTVDDGVWHHVALVGNLNTQSAYLDGVSMGALAGGLNHYQMTQNQVGTGRTTQWANGNDTWFPFAGLVDEVRVWHRARTVEEIQSTLFRELQGSETGLVGYWDFNEGSGQVVHDRSSRAADATLGFDNTVEANDPIWVGEGARLGVLEKFDSVAIESPWTWIRENPAKWSLSDRPGFLRIYSEDGDIWSVPNDAKNLLVRPMLSENVEVTIRFEADPVVDFQQVSLFLYEDGDNYVKNCLVFADYRGGLGVHLGKDVDDFYLSQSVVISSATEYYIRLEKVGNNYTGSYSFDGHTWMQNGYYANVPINPTLVGLGAWNSKGQTGPTAEMVADFDSFQMIQISGSAAPTATPTATPFPTRTSTPTPTPSPAIAATPTSTPPMNLAQAPDVSILPTDPRTTDDLTALAQWEGETDSEGIVFHFEWSRNNETLFSETRFSEPGSGGLKGLIQSFEDFERSGSFHDFARRHDRMPGDGGRQGSPQHSRVGPGRDSKHPTHSTCRSHPARPSDSG